MGNVVLRNSEAEQYICAAQKNFILDDKVSDSNTKMLICHFSDIHGDKQRFENVMELIEYFKPDFAVHTGDLVKWNSADDSDFFFERTVNSDFPIYNAIGNHETFGNDGLHAGGALANEYLHKRYIAPLRNINSNANKGWYYTDFDLYRLRLIVLNPYEYFYEDDFQIRGTRAFLQEQSEWFANVLRDASEKEYAVIVAAHEFAEEVAAASNNWGFCQRFEPHPWGKAKKRQENYIIEDIVAAFQSGTYIKKEFVCDISGQKVSVDCNFEKKGEFICYLAGHRHGDYVGYLPKHPSQLSITMTCSGCYPKGYHNIGEELSDLARIPETVSEDAVNFYVIDREKKNISIIRVGAAMNDLLEPRRVLVLPYIKKSV